MRMKWVWLGVLLMFSVLPGVQAQNGQPDEIRLASEVWEDYTETDGTGLAWDIMRRVFEPAGVRLDIHSVPYTRSVGLVQRGEADAWVGSYRDELKDGVFYPQYPYDRDQIVALSLKDKPLPTLDNLGEHRLVWVRGYRYEEYICRMCATTGKCSGGPVFLACSIWGMPISTSTPAPRSIRY